jgi:ankyrin repeat protein
VAALAGRYFQLAQVLHRNGSSVEPRDDYEGTPLHSAAFYRDLEMVQVLLEYGVDVKAQNRHGSTPLSFASSGNRDDPRVARLLIERGADPNTRNWRGSTPLLDALEYGMIEIARALIELGANVEVKDDDGRTPLDIASLAGEQREEMIKLLLEHRAK